MRGLVATHGGIGAELVEVVAMIMGPGTGLESLSNHGKSAHDLTEEIVVWLQGEGESGAGSQEPAIIFIDDYGGSCANAAQLACRPSDPVALVSGVNLAMLLGFATWHEELELEELVQRLVERGRTAITRLGGAS